MKEMWNTLLALIFVVCSLFLLMMTDRSREESRAALRFRFASHR